MQIIGLSTVSIATNLHTFVFSAICIGCKKVLFSVNTIKEEPVCDVEMLDLEVRTAVNIL